jgi:hypothetical protein
MDCRRAFADIRPGRQRFATSALLIRKGAETLTTNASFLSFGR